MTLAIETAICATTLDSVDLDSHTSRRVTLLTRVGRASKSTRSYGTQVARILSVSSRNHKWFHVFIALIVAVTAGCATTAEQTPEKPEFAGKAFAAAPVGKVVPVYVAIRCIRGCPLGLDVSSEEVYAVSDEGKTTQALRFNDAIAAAGGAVVLAPALTSTSDLTTVGAISGVGAGIGRALAGGTAQSGPGVGALLTVPAGLLVGALYGGYLAAADPQELQRIKLIPLSFGSSGKRASGWMFFPKGSYKEVKIKAKAAATGTAPFPPQEITLPVNKLSRRAATELGERPELRSNTVMTAQLPSIEATAPPHNGTRVGLTPAVDARQESAVASTVEVGPAVAAQADTLMANELTDRGYAVERIPSRSAHAALQRLVSITVLSTRLRVSVVRVAIEVATSDAQGQQNFSRTYVGEEPYRLMIPFTPIAIASASAMGQALNDALSLAIAKACNDPAFIAALRSGGTEEEGSRTLRVPQ